MIDQNIAHTLAEIAASQPEKTALVEKVLGGYRNWTFKELDEHASAYAHGLKAMGISKDDRTVLMVRPSMEFICLTFALFRLGSPVILIDPGMGYRNLLRCISTVQPTAFIGVPKAHLFRLINFFDFFSATKNVCVGPDFGIFGKSLKGIADFDKGPFPTTETSADEQAAIIFTTGSTGPPKGVNYSHGNFRAQLEQIRDYYRISSDDIDQPAFPLFALFSAALGACAVIPQMDTSRPAKVDPALFTRSIIDQQVTYSFGSPAIWNVVSRYCLEKGIVLDSLRLVLMAGAPVPGELVERVKRIISVDGDVQTPYGATESLPVTSISGDEIVTETWAQSITGSGTCVGRPLPGIDIKVVRLSDQPIEEWSGIEEMPAGEIGEIVVRGGVVTSSYYNNDQETRLAKIRDGKTFWHRIGDLGYLDKEGRLWFCGRRAHRVETATGPMYTIPCEAIFNEHPEVYRSALVGIGGERGEETPVMVIEPFSPAGHPKLIKELRDMGQASELTKNIDHFLIKREFPVDIRHNAKIFREKLAVWAEKRLGPVKS
jgi:acyl-CoA synthetase (AMP-forming)/AMP-acid ligase II